QPELRNVLNNPDLRQLKQRVSLRCDISALPNVEETAQYIAHRLKVAGAERADIFSPGAIDYIFRCSEGIPRNINNLCDNALLNGFAASESVISRGIVEEVAATFDMVPRADHLKNSEEREGPARIFNAAGRAELWAAGNGDSVDGNGNGNSDNVSDFVPKHVHPWERQPFTGMPQGYDSASTAHTEETTGGPALPGGPASRDAGATLGAVGSARAAEFSSREVLAA